MTRQIPLQGIRLDGVYKAYGNQQVLTGFSADLPTWGRVAVMGPSGAGKTTLARLVMGLERPDAGSILGTEGMRFACVFQEDRLCEGFTASDNVSLVLPRTRWSEVEPALAELGLAGEDLTKPAGELSGGQKRRVALARAILAQADLVVLDEAFKGLDDENRQHAYDFVLRSFAARPRTLLLITHDVAEARALGAGEWMLTGG